MYFLNFVMELALPSNISFGTFSFLSTNQVHFSRHSFTPKFIIFFENKYNLLGSIEMVHTMSTRKDLMTNKLCDCDGDGD